MSLQVKVVAFLLVIAMVPLAVAAVLIDQSAEAALNFASNEAAFLRPPLVKAKSTYIGLVEAKRDLYYREAARRVAGMAEIRALLAEPRSADGDRAIDALLAETRELQRIAIVDGAGRVIVERETSAPVGVAYTEWHPLEVVEAISPMAAQAGPEGDSAAANEPPGPGQARLTFAADSSLQNDYAELLSALERAEDIDKVRSALPSNYRLASLLLVGVVVLMVSTAGIIIARRFTRRIFALVSGTRVVAAGDLQSRVELTGRDELAELAQAFNRMVENLAHDREQIAYLQRVSTWQDVARKMAHEIKNPLTPIQLAVQQCVSSYPGDDERYRRLLRDAEEIVTEEISSLRRLVDAFRTLGQLPKVEAKPLDLGSVVDDLTKDPVLLDHIELAPPDQPVMVRGDRMLLRRVLTNLVENGIHAGQGAGAPGKVCVAWGVRDGRVELTVDDEGPGVPEDRRDKIFEPYVTHKDQGTGLGLTISKKLALEHRGSLGLAHEPAPTGGARFVLTLPVAESGDEASEV